MDLSKWPIAKIVPAIALVVIAIVAMTGDKDSDTTSEPVDTKLAIDIAEPVSRDGDAGRRILYAAGVSTGGRKISAVGRPATTLQIFDGDCTSAILDELGSSIGGELRKLGFAVMVCYDGSEVFASKSLAP